MKCIGSVARFILPQFFSFLFNGARDHSFEAKNISFERNFLLRSAHDETISIRRINMEEILTVTTEKLIFKTCIYSNKRLQNVFELMCRMFLDSYVMGVIEHN